MNNKHLKLLAVDDDKAIRQYLTVVCKRLGFEVESVADKSALERQLVAVSPDIILLDLQLPGEDGVQILKMLKDYGSNARIILVSGMDERTISTIIKVGESLGLNMDGALTKPVLIDTLRNKLGKLGHHGTRVRADDLERAIANGEIRPAFQPKSVRKSDANWAITETEALARWHRSDSSVIFPGDFLGVAERAGLLAELTASMLEQVASQLRRWETRGHKFSAAVNLSPCTLTDSQLPDRLEALMQKYTLENSRLTLELTESAAIQNEGLAMEILSRLRILGFGLSIDDFGTGYSSLEQLYRMPFNELKIDRFLVRDIGVRREAELIAEAIISLGHKLNLAVCAEGVETAVAVDFLYEAGCDKLQGFYLGRPSSAEALEHKAREFDQHGFGLDVLMARHKGTRLPAPARYQ